MNYLYTKQDCGGCETARSLLNQSHTEFTEIPINNPLVELGIQVLFKDGLVHAPVLVKPSDGIYILIKDNTFSLIKNLKKRHKEVTSA